MWKIVFWNLDVVMVCCFIKVYLVKFFCFFFFSKRGKWRVIVVFYFVNWNKKIIIKFSNVDLNK